MNTLKKNLIIYGYTIGGGAVSTIFAFFKELPFLLIPFISAVIVAPLMEELLKPMGVFHLLNKHAKLLPSRGFVAFLGALSGLTFATLENLLYLYVYFPNHTAEFAIFRFTVCTTVHVVCSAIVGWGAGAQLEELKQGDEETFFDLEKSMGWLVTAILLHAAYNTFATFIPLFDKRMW